MAAASGETKKPPGAAKAAPKKPAKRAGAAAKKPASASAKKPASASAAAKKPASASAATAKKPKAGAPAAKKPAKRASAATKKPARGASAAAKGASPAAKKPARGASAPAKKPVRAAPPAAASSTATGAAVAETKEPPSRAPAKRTVVKDAARSYFDALAARDSDAAAQVWDADAVNDIVPLGIFRGQVAIRGFIEELFAAMPDGRFTVERIIADEKAAAVQWRIAGTFDGESFQGLEPTGRRVDLRGSDCLEIEEGKIVHNTGVFDGAAFARQVGLLPAEDSGADRAMRAGFNTVTKLRRTVARRTAR